MQGREMTKLIQFGKYKGKRVGEIDDLEYLIWVKNQCRPEMRKAIGKQINKLQTNTSPLTKK